MASRRVSAAAPNAPVSPVSDVSVSSNSARQKPMKNLFLKLRE
jgi:hypothetical protein